jgi:glyceraldehyde 3-phosphate dehydrogenase
MERSAKMAIRVGINGFGRIGRQLIRVMYQYYPGKFDVVAINDLYDTRTNAHLFKYDTNYGKYGGKVEVVDDDIVIDGDRLKVFREPDPRKLPWKDVGAQIVFEATGVFRDAKASGDKPGAGAHIEAGGAEKVIITAPAKNEDLMVVIGVNEDLYDPKKHHIISNASCTTNCLAPVAKIVHEELGIVRGMMTTVHAYTNDQKILDLAHKDLRRARAAALNIIPTTTGAAKAVAKVIPELEGKFHGFAIRVPTATVSLVDFVAELEQTTSTTKLNSLFKQAAEGSLKGILGYTEEPLVSMDLKGDPRSSIVDGLSTMVMEGNLAKIVSWYDNEWAYSVRSVDLALIIGKSL